MRPASPPARASLEETQRLLALPRLLAAAREPGSVAKFVVATVAELVPTARIALLAWNADTSSVHLLATHGLRVEAAGEPAASHLSAAALYDVDVLLRGGSISHEAAASSGDPILNDIVGDSGGSVHAVPIEADGKTVATLLVAATDDAMLESARAPLRIVIDQAALALHNLLLSENARSAAEYLRTDTELLRRVASNESLDATLARLAEQIERHTGGACAITLLDPSQTSLTVVAAPSLPPAFTSILATTPMLTPSSPGGSAAQTLATTVVADFAAREHSEIAATAIRNGLRACTSVPIGGREDHEVWGTIDVYYGVPHEPDEHERRVLHRAVQLARIALDRAGLVDELRQVALHDALTALPNRLLFIDKVRDALVGSGPDTAPLAVAVVDLDDFKSVNETLGHSAGDEVLAAASRRIRTCLRPEDIAARLGADEFGLLLQNSNVDAAEAVATQVMRAFEDPISVHGTNLSVDVSIGIARGPAERDVAESILRRADAALRAAKEGGKACIRIFDQKMHAAIEDRLAIQEDLVGAVERDELTVHYQPVFALHSQRIVEVEALVRWKHPTRGLVPPGQFIPIAEENGMIATIGSWVLRRTLEQLASWRATIGDAAPRRVAINLSAAQLNEGDLVSEIKAALDETGLHGPDLTLEITETLLMEDTRTAKEKLTSLRDLGIHIAVDDFGSGYASLSYLKQFPIDVLKIDRDIIADVDGPPEAAGLPHAIVKLGQSLGMRIVAEGIERAAQRNRLVDLGCDLGQGYLFSHPLDSPEAERFLVYVAGSNEWREDVTPHA